MKYILIINAGSTSIKFKIFSFPKLSLIESGGVNHIGDKRNRINTHEQGLHDIFLKIKTPINDNNIIFIGHRIVHGGSEFIKPTKLSRSNLKSISKYNELAPLHNPADLKCARKCINHFKKTPNYGVFDTSFHQTIPEENYTYPIPAKISKKYNIRKYGFHGISCKYLTSKASSYIKKPTSSINLIICHLGGGSSVTAIKKGKSFNTSMGYTPTQGVTMMTRSGDIDPQVPYFIEKYSKETGHQVHHLLNTNSGLYGLTGELNMLKIYELIAKNNKKVTLAYNIFVNSIVKYISYYAVLLKKTDLIVFSGSIGSGKPKIRKDLKSKLAPLIKTKILSIKTNEEYQIASDILNEFKYAKNTMP